MIKAIILDLDDTLINTKVLEPLRAAGKWYEIPSLMSQCTVYEDVLGVLNTARAAGMKIAIFTNAPSRYVQNLLSHFNISVDFTVAYHDVRNRKPHSDGVDKILSHFGLSNSEAIYIGDSDLDKYAASNAGVEFFTVEWGSASNVDQDHIGASKLSELIGRRLEKKSNFEFRSEIQQTGNRFFLGYYLEGVKQEVWTFKDGTETAIDRWCKKTEEVAEYLPSVDLVVRALGHSELKATGTGHPLDSLALSLAKVLGARYRPELVEKNRVLAKSTKMSAPQRLSQVSGAYSVRPSSIPTPKFEKLTFLIVDDVYTSGATTNEISRAISEAYPEASIYVFTLVKTLFRKEARKASAEVQLNTQLFSDLYDPVNATKNSGSNQEMNEHRKFKGKLINKKYSANYSKTNHNFVIQNLHSYSIASESNSIPIFNAVQILKNILQRGKPTIASRRLRNAYGLNLDDSAINTSALALISNKPVTWHRLIRSDKKPDHHLAKRFFDELITKHLGEYGFVKQLTLPKVQILDITQVYIDQFQNRQVDFFIPQVGLIIEIDGFNDQQSEKANATRDAFT